MTIATSPAQTAPRQTANPAPMRPAGSIRRTSSIDIEWIEGQNGMGMNADRRFYGRVRDYLTPLGGGAGKVIDEAQMVAILDTQKAITEITATPAPARLGELVGLRGGGHLRVLMQDIMPELIATGAPLYLVLDDLSGTSLISGWAWALYNPNWMIEAKDGIPADQLAKLQDRAGVCWGLKPGNSGLTPDRESFTVNSADGGELRNPADPEGWHEFPHITGVTMRRARRIDVWREGGLIHIDAAFQDSAPRPAGPDGISPGRAALHEYRLSATADANTLELRTLAPEPRVLPFPECPGAVANTQKLLGTPLPQIRAAVLAELRGPAGCTHLNDALRALAEVPILAGKLAG